MYVFCNNMLRCNVAKYAAKNDMPYIASGLSATQLSSGREYPLEAIAIANAIVEKSTKMVMKNAIDGFRKQIHMPMMNALGHILII